MLNKEQIDYIATFKPYILKLCNDETVAQDILQDCYLNILSRANIFNTLPPDEGTNTDRSKFIRTVIKHAYIDYIRVNKKLGKVEEINSYNGLFPYHPAVSKLISYNNSYSSIQLKEINGLLNTIKGGKQLNLVAQGYKCKDVATVFKMPLNTVLTHCYNARAILKLIYK